MRFVILGAGAVGGTIGGRLAEHGNEVLLLARGRHAEVLAADGLTLVTPEGARTLHLPVASDAADLQLRADDVLVLATKTQDTAGVLEDLGPAATDLPVICAQNGVENERLALRRFPNVYGVCVMLPADHLEPGVVHAQGEPHSGLLDIGCYPRGVDERCRAIAAALSASGFVSEAVPDVMRWKYAKLLLNLGNAIEALGGVSPIGRPAGEPGAELQRLLLAEAEQCLQAAGVEAVPPDEWKQRRGGLVRIAPTGNRQRPGGSTWQSLARGTGTVEVDYLNGEIVLLGRLHGIPTPANALLQAAANDAARRRVPPGSITVPDLLARLSRS